MKLLNKKYFPIALVIVLALVFMVGSSGIAMAQSAVNASPNTSGSAPSQPPDLYSCATSGDLATCLVYFVTWFVANIMGLFISLGAVLIKLGLAIDANIYNSPFIQTGFSVCLSIANLGFVLAIIIIAIATIFHSESYGAKKTLWRVVVMAILINFGLVITAPIVNFANGLTTYFTNSVSGTVGIGNFVSNTAAAFAPQNLSQATTANASSMCSGALNNLTFPLNTLLPTNTINNICNKITGQSNPSPATSFSQALMSLVFQIIFSFFIALAFFGLGALLLVRYVWLGVLLVVLPFAWLAWVFPKFSGQFGKWWSNFIKWTFFPPAAIFFVYLALLITTQTPASAGGSSYLASVGQAASGGSAAQTGNVPEASIAQQIGQVIPLETAENDIIIIGLMLGGLIAASSLTGKAGSFVVEQAKGVSGAVQGYVGKQTKKAARATYQKAGGQKFTARLQEGNIGALKYIPGARRVASLSGRGVASISSNTKMVEDAKKGVPKDREEVLQRLRGSMNTEDTLAHIGQAVKDGYLKRDSKINGVDAQDYFDQNRDVLKRYGQGKLLVDANKLFMSDSNYRFAENAVKNNRGQDINVSAVDDIKDSFGKVVIHAGEIVSAFKLMDVSIKQMVESMSKEDAAKVDGNSAFGPGANIEDITRRLGAAGLYSPAIVSSLLKKMKSPTLRNIQNIYMKVIDDKVGSETVRIESERKDVMSSSALTDKQKQEQVQELNTLITELKPRAEKAKEVIGKSVAHTVLQAAHDEHEEEEHGDEKKGSKEKPSRPSPASGAGGSQGSGESGGGGSHNGGGGEHH